MYMVVWKVLSKVKWYSELQYLNLQQLARRYKLHWCHSVEWGWSATRSSQGYSNIFELLLCEYSQNKQAFSSTSSSQRSHSCLRGWLPTPANFTSMDIASLALPAETFTPWKPAQTICVTSWHVPWDTQNPANTIPNLLTVSLGPLARIYMSTK